MPLSELEPLINPRSIALVGASPRPETSGRTLLDMVDIDGYQGKVYLVNPRYQEIEGRPCYPSLDDLPETVDHVAIALSNKLIESALDQVIEHGAGAATIFASCISEDYIDPPLFEVIKRKAENAGLKICGGNSMGLYNRVAGFRIASFGSKISLREGGIAWVAQSGSAITALVHGDQRVGFTLSVSTGMELTTTAAEYAQWSLGRPQTKVIGMFLESVRDPYSFVEMLKQADRQNVAVVILKVGRTERSAAMAQSHTGAIAGNDAAFNAVCDQYGVVRVQDFDEMIATLQLFDREVVVCQGGLATMHDSGGEREMIVDIADDLEVKFAEISEATQQIIRNNLDIGLVAENPLDAWGTPNDSEHRFVSCLTALANDDDTGLVYFCSNPRDDYWYAESLIRVVEQTKSRTQKPLAMICNSGLANNSEVAGRLADKGIPLINGSREALLAARHVMTYRDFSNQVLETVASFDESIIGAINNELNVSKANGSVISEQVALSQLHRCGFPVARSESVSTEQDALNVAQNIGYPVVLKTACGSLHKTETNGVLLDLRDKQSVSKAYLDLSTRLGPQVIVAPMLSKGIELALGALVDPAFGPVVMISAGGTLIEVLNDKCTIAAPFCSNTAKKNLKKMRIWSLLKGVRGQGEVDIDGLCDAISRFSVFVSTFSQMIKEVDVNPIIVSVDNCCAVDALIILSD